MSDSKFSAYIGLLYRIGLVGFLTVSSFLFHDAWNDIKENMKINRESMVALKDQVSTGFSESGVRVTRVEGKIDVFNWRLDRAELDIQDLKKQTAGGRK